MVEGVFSMNFPSTFIAAPGGGDFTTRVAGCIAGVLTTASSACELVAAGGSGCAGGTVEFCAGAIGLPSCVFNLAKALIASFCPTGWSSGQLGCTRSDDTIRP